MNFIKIIILKFLFIILFLVSNICIAQTAKDFLKQKMNEYETKKYEIGYIITVDQKKIIVDPSRFNKKYPGTGDGYTNADGQWQITNQGKIIYRSPDNIHGKIKTEKVRYVVKKDITFFYGVRKKLQRYHGCMSVIAYNKDYILAKEHGHYEGEKGLVVYKRSEGFKSIPLDYYKPKKSPYNSGGSRNSKLLELVNTYFPDCKELKDKINYNKSINVRLDDNIELLNCDKSEDLISEFKTKYEQ